MNRFCTDIEYAIARTLEPHADRHWCLDEWRSDRPRLWRDRPATTGIHPPEPLLFETDPRAMVVLLTEMRRRGYDFTIEDAEPNSSWPYQWEVRCYKSKEEVACVGAATLMRAVALACAKALGHDID